MVSGHVLQPAMVSIPKLDDIWRARITERMQGRVWMDMSTIGEQSVSADETSSTSLRDESSITDKEDEVEDNTSLQNSLNAERGEDTLQTSSLRKSLSPPKSVRGNRSGCNTPASSPNTSSSGYHVSPRTTGASENKKDRKKSTKVVSPPQSIEEDPLEGPSWLHSPDNTRRRVRGGRVRGRAAVNGVLRSTANSTSSPQTHTGHSTQARSGMSNKKNQSKKSPTSEKNPTKGSKDSPKKDAVLSPHNLDQSYFSSYANMLTRLENLEEKSGRRSKSKSKGRSLKTSGAFGDNLSKPDQNECNSNSSEPAAKQASLLLDATSPTIFTTVEDYGVFRQPLLKQDNTFLIKDSDLTCIVDESMDITGPLCDIPAQASSKQLELESGRSSKEKKFFKDQHGSRQQNPGKEKTPFDMSLMEATFEDIPSYSSRNMVEKENMPPHQRKVSHATDTNKGTLNLRRVSVVLEDVMKCTDVQNSLLQAPLSSSSFNKPSTLVCEDKEEVQVIEENHGELPVDKKRMTKYTLDSDVEEPDSQDDNWSPHTNKRNQRKLKRNSKAPVVRKRSTQTEIVKSPIKRRRRKNRSESEAPYVIISSRVRKRSTQTEIVKSPIKRRRRKNRSESEAPYVIISSRENSVDRETDDKLSCNSYQSSNINTKATNRLSECFVKIQRTPISEINMIVGTKEVDDEIDSASDNGYVENKDSNSAYIEDETKSGEVSRCSIVNGDHQVTEKSNAPPSPLTADEPCDSNSFDVTSVVSINEAEIADPATAEEFVPEQLYFEELEEENRHKDERIVEIKEENAKVSSQDHDAAKNVDLENNKEEEMKEDPDLFLDVKPSRQKRGAALKIASFKEPHLNLKMRNTGETKRNSQRRK
ncbi:hypothetical protein SK128_001007 [Halocaridina rubra]|uniref:Uncharacterized protein n=1 Tax=Halocaridina rubra TaxID=373956 RepID=A0AAN8XIA3_HALRR